MHRNMYDTDVTVWSPEGRLLQVIEWMEGPRRGEKLENQTASGDGVLRIERDVGGLRRFSID